MAVSFYHLLTIALVVQSSLADEQTWPCLDECVSHKSGSFHCANSQCTEFPVANRTVQNIYLQHNAITALPEIHYPQLLLLNLTENLITVLEPGTFFDASSLQTLYLGSNKLRIADSDAFKGLKFSLETLDLSDNEITDLGQDAFVWLSMLKSLDLSRNRIVALTKTSLSDLKNLELLHLAGNQIREIDAGCFLGLSNLLHLDLSSNAITTVGKKSVYECTRLEALNLFNNSISTIEANAFTYAANLQTIHLQQNALRSLDPATFRLMGDNGGRLESVYLDWNPLEQLPASVFPRSVNRISLDHMHQLQFIGDDVFKDISILQELMINNNPKLGRISATAFGGEVKTPVQVLTLTNNSLQGLYEDMLEWGRLSDANLRNNPWHCDCNMKWMLEPEAKVREEVLSHIVCATPDFLAGMSLSQISVDSLSCDPIYEYQGKILKVLLVVLLLIIIVVLGAMVYRHRNRLFARCTDKNAKYRSVFNTATDDCEVDLYKDTKKVPEMDDNDEI